MITIYFEKGFTVGVITTKGKQSMVIRVYNDYYSVLLYETETVAPPREADRFIRFLAKEQSDLQAFHIAQGTMPIVMAQEWFMSKYYKYLKEI